MGVHRNSPDFTLHTLAGAGRAMALINGSGNKSSPGEKVNIWIETVGVGGQAKEEEEEDDDGEGVVLGG